MYVASASIVPHTIARARAHPPLLLSLLSLSSSRTKDGTAKMDPCMKSLHLGRPSNQDISEQEDTSIKPKKKVQLGINSFYQKKQQKRPHKSQNLIYKIYLLQIVKVILSNCLFMGSQLRLFYLAIVFNVSDKNCISSCKNKCYVLIHLKKYFEKSDFTGQLNLSSSTIFLFFYQIFLY